jgi:hypothetical protein
VFSTISFCCFQNCNLSHFVKILSRRITRNKREPRETSTSPLEPAAFAHDMTRGGKEIDEFVRSRIPRPIPFPCKGRHECFTRSRAF